MFATELAHWNINNVFINKRSQKRIMLIFKTPPCTKIHKEGRCLTCGFNYHARDVEGYDLAAQFNSVKEIIKKRRIEHIDLLSSGSLLDNEQIEYSQLLALIKEISALEPVKSVLIEGRVEHCDIRKMREIKNLLGAIDLEYGIGLECYSDKIRNDILNKNLDINDYIGCIKKLKKEGIGISTYILMGIPYLQKEQMLTETISSIIDVVGLYKQYKCKGRIALYPVFVMPNTVIEELYEKKEYDLVKINDIIHVLSEANKQIDLKKWPIFVGFDDEGISNKRYAGYNEAKKLTELVELFNSNQDIEVFRGVMKNEAKKI